MSVESSDIASRVSVLETSVAAIHSDVGDIKTSIARLATGRATNWGTIWSAAGVVASFFVTIVGGLYWLVSTRIDAVWESNGRLVQRVESKFEKLDQVDNE